MFGNASGRPPVTIGTMHCKACLYVLDGLDAGACPECGRAFDPADPATYATNRIDQDRPRLLLIGGGLVVVLAAIAVRSVFTYDDSTLFLVVLYGLPGILSYFIGPATLRATPSIRSVMLVCTPALLMLGSYYSLALHMRWALQGWPATIGTNGFPQSLIVHCDIAMFCLIGVTLAAVPDRKTSSAMNNSVLSTGRSITGMSIALASSITLARVMPSRMS